MIREDPQGQRERMGNWYLGICVLCNMGERKPGRAGTLLPPRRELAREGKLSSKSTAVEWGLSGGTSGKRKDSAYNLEDALWGLFLTCLLISFLLSFLLDFGIPLAQPSADFKTDLPSPFLSVSAMKCWSALGRCRTTCQESEVFHILCRDATMCCVHPKYIPIKTWILKHSWKIGINVCGTPHQTWVYHHWTQRFCELILGPTLFVFWQFYTLYCN